MPSPRQISAETLSRGASHRCKDGDRPGGSMCSSCVRNSYSVQRLFFKNNPHDQLPIISKKVRCEVSPTSLMSLVGDAFLKFTAFSLRIGLAQQERHQRVHPAVVNSTVGSSPAAAAGMG